MCIVEILIMNLAYSNQCLFCVSFYSMLYLQALAIYCVCHWESEEQFYVGAFVNHVPTLGRKCYRKSFALSCE